MKKITAVLIISLSIFLIYYFNKDTDIYYVALGDKENDYYEKVEKGINTRLEKSNFTFLKENQQIEKLKNQIDDNEKVNKQTIKNALIKADLVTISIKTDIVSDNEYDFSKIDNEAQKFEKLLKLIKSYCKETIIIVGPKDEKSGSLKYLNKTFRNIATKHDIYYIKTENAEQVAKDILKKIGIKTWFCLENLLQ